MLSRKHVPQEQINTLLEQGVIPVSVDYRLCPEVDIVSGPVCDVRDAVQWARSELPHLQLRQTSLRLDGSRVGVVGWSSGGALALLLGQTIQNPKYRHPDAIVTFYCPTDFEDECMFFGVILTSHYIK